MGTSTVMKAGEFKAQCLQLMDRVAASGDVIVITKRGKPVAQLSALQAAKPATLAGYFKDRLEFIGDAVSPVELDWGPADPAIEAGKPKARRGGQR